MLKNGHTVILVTEKLESEIDIPDAIHYCLKFRVGNPLTYYNTFLQLKDIIKRNKIDIIHAQQRTAGYFSLALNKHLDIPFVLTLHDIWHRAPLKKMHGKLFTNVIAVSEFIRRHFVGAFAARAEDVVTIHNGVDESRFNTDELLHQKGMSFRCEMGISSTNKVITLIGRVIKSKGHYDLIEAVEKISGRVQNFIVLIVGAGPDELQLKQLVSQRDLDKIVVFGGYRSDIPAILAATDIVVLPSYREALGLSIIEAMFAKKPVIATKVGGIPELVSHGKTGILIEPGDVSGLANGMLELLSDGEKAVDFGERGYNKAKKDFSLTNMVTETEAFYKRIIQANKPFINDKI